MKHWGAPVRIGGKPIVVALSWLCRSFHNVIGGVPSAEFICLCLTNDSNTHPGARDPIPGTRHFCM